MNPRGSRGQRRARRGDDIVGFAAFQARFYPPLAIPVAMTWLVNQGVVGLWVAVVLGAALLVVAHLLIPWMVRWLLEKPVKLEGCGVAQFFYWASPLLLAGMYWWGGVDLFLITLLALPVVLVFLAVLLSRVVQPRKRHQR